MIIYKTTCLVNNMIYVGQTRTNDKNYLGSGKDLQKAIKEFGRSNFKRDTVCECNSQDELNEKEQFWIKELDSMNPEVGYNLCTGGSSGYVFTESVKAKISQSNMEREYRPTPEHIENIKKANIGRKFTEEHKEKIRQANIGHTFSQQSIEKMSKSRTGKKLSEQTKKLLSEALSGEKNPNYGKKHSKEILQKIRSNHGNNEAILEYDLNMNFIKEWASSSEASRFHNINKSSIRKAVTGKLNNSGCAGMVKKISRIFKFKETK